MDGFAKRCGRCGTILILYIFAYKIRALCSENHEKVSATPQKKGVAKVWHFKKGVA